MTQRMTERVITGLLLSGAALPLATGTAAAGDLGQAVSAGARILKPAVRLDWGLYSGYVADPDGHPWEFAYNPGFPIGEDGRITIS